MDQQVAQQPVSIPVQTPMTAEPDIASILTPQAPDHTQVPAVAPVAAPVPAPEPAPTPQPTPTVPLPELLEQRHARQMAEYKAQQAEARLAEYQRAMEAQFRASQPQPQPIDPVAEPERAFAALAQRQDAIIQSQQEMAIHQRANTSEMLARGKHGDAVVDAAVQAAIEAGVNRNFMAKPDPYKALMDWHNTQTIAQQVGPDLKSWEARKEAEIRAKVMAEMGIKPAAVNGVVPQTTTLPPSLSTATRANNAVPVVEDANDFFKGMFGPKRKG